MAISELWPLVEAVSAMLDSRHLLCVKKSPLSASSSSPSPSVSTPVLGKENLFVPASNVPKIYSGSDRVGFILNKTVFNTAKSLVRDFPSLQKNDCTERNSKASGALQVNHFADNSKSLANQNSFSTVVLGSPAQSGRHGESASANAAAGCGHDFRSNQLSDASKLCVQNGSHNNNKDDDDDDDDDDVSQDIYICQGESATLFFQLLTQKLREKKTELLPLKGWRNELYAVYGCAANDVIKSTLIQDDSHENSGSPGFADGKHKTASKTQLFKIERSAAHLFGFITYGCHVTAFRRDPSTGKPAFIYVARRALSRPTWPGCLDTTVGGGLGARDTPRSCVRRELLEEAGLQALGRGSAVISAPDAKMDLADSEPGLTACDRGVIKPAAYFDERALISCGSVSYIRKSSVPNGRDLEICPEKMYVYDLEIRPADDSEQPPAPAYQTQPCDSKSQLLISAAADADHNQKGSSYCCYSEPENKDGEVSAFYCIPIDQVVASIMRSEFTPAACVTTVDFLIRHGVIAKPVDNETEALVGFEKLNALLHWDLEAMGWPVADFNEY